MKEEILKFWKGDAEDDKETLKKYSRDASIFEVFPKLVLFPKDSEDVKNLVKWVSANKDKYDNLSITPRCAGTDMSGGAIGESIILDFTRHMNKILSYPRADHPYITVEPGVFYRDFEKVTLEHNLVLPCYTASKSLNTLGGMYGNNSAGERTLKYGKTEEYVVSSKVVFSNGGEYIVKSLPVKDLNEKISSNNFEGNVYKNIFEILKNNKEEIEKAKPKVHKNSAGYYLWNIEEKNINENYFNLNKLLVGSQGTLGITTEITFKLVPEPKYSKLVVVFMKDLEPLGRLIGEILTQKPETLEVYDDKTIKLATRFFTDFLKNKGIINMMKFMWSFLPEFFMMLSGGFPNLVVLAEFAGENEREVNTKCKKLKELIRGFNLKTHITKSKSESEKYWDIRRQSFALLRKHVSGKHTAPFVDDIIVRPEFLPKFLPKLNKILGEYDITYTLAGHLGDGNFHIIPLMDFKEDKTRDIIMELSEKVYDLIKEFKGSNTAEHNDGLIRTPFLYKMFDEDILVIFKRVKNVFDPQNIFNPGKKIPTEKYGGTKEYLRSHIAISHEVSHGS